MRTLSLVLLALMATGCVQVEKARLQFASDGKGDIAIRTLIAREAFDPDGHLKERILADSQQCGFGTQFNRRGDKFVLEQSASFAGNVALARQLDCMPFDWRRRIIRMRTDSSLLYRKYKTLVVIEQPLALRPSQSELRSVANPEEPIEDNEFVANEMLFPQELEVTVPGRIVEMSDRSAIAGGMLSGSFVDNVATIRMAFSNKGQIHTDAVDREVDRLNRDPDAQAKADRYETEILSREARFDLTTLTTLAVILFGSGIAAPLLSYLRRRPAGPAARPPLAD